MYATLIVITTAIAVLLIIIVLLQSSKGGGLAGTFGGQQAEWAQCSEQGERPTF